MTYKVNNQEEEVVEIINENGEYEYIAVAVKSN